MNEELDQTGAVGVSPTSLYKLDWESIEVTLAKGRFTHILRRPTAEQILKREDDLQQEIPIRPDGSYSLPDPTLGEAVDAKLYDEIVVEAQGYTDAVWDVHKSHAVQAIYRREVELEEGADPFGEEIAIIEEIGSGDLPDFTVRHVMRRPSQSELDSYRRKSAAGSQIKPGKRGRQVLVTKSNLKHLIPFYDLWLVRVEGATVGGETFTDATRADFLAAVDPLIKRRVVAELAEAISAALRD